MSTTKINWVGNVENVFYTCRAVYTRVRVQILFPCVGGGKNTVGHHMGEAHSKVAKGVKDRCKKKDWKHKLFLRVGTPTSHHPVTTTALQ